MQRIASRLLPLRLLRIISVVLLLTMALATIPAHVDATAPYLLLPDNPYTAFTNVQGAAKMSYQTVPISGQDFDQALQMTTFQAPDSAYQEGEYSVSLAGAITASVKQGDALLATFWARAVTPGPDGSAYTGFQFERNGGAYTKSDSEVVKAGTQWQQFQFPFRAAETYQPGEAQVTFWLGYNPQSIEVGGLSVLDYGAGNPANYPSVTYAGREADASWRTAAEARIEKYRQGNLTVVVKGTDGKPIPNATVQVNMQSQDFQFGSAISAAWLRSNTPDGEKYRQTISQLFNTVVLGNDLKWPEWEDVSARNSTTLPALEWLHEHNIGVRGHNLVWPSWSLMPADVKSLSNDPAALSARVDNHILDETSALQGQVVSWDVLNEPYSNHNLQDILLQYPQSGSKKEGPWASAAAQSGYQRNPEMSSDLASDTSAMADWFEKAAQGDPNTPLFINDYNNVEHNGWDQRHIDFYYNTIKTLLQEGAPIGGIGLQSHFQGNQLTSSDQLTQVLDQFASLGLPIEVSEFDIDTTDQQLQADYTRDFMTLLYSYPQVQGIIEWGFWAPDHWRPNGASYLADWTQKPNGQVWEDLVKHQWWTDAQGTTGSNGTYQVRGYTGTYNVSVTVNGVTKTVKTSLSNKGRTLTVIADGKPSTLPTTVNNLALNGSFEAGNVAWTPIGAGAQIVAGGIYGNHALQTGTDASGWTQSLIDVDAGTNYTLSGYAKVNGKNATCWIGVRGGQYPGLPAYTQALSFTGQHYSQQSLSFTIPAGVTWQKVFVWKDPSDSSATCSFDEIQFVQTSGQPPPEPTPPATLPQLPPELALLNNGNFESGTSGWYCFGACTLAATTDPVHAGSGAASITNRSASWQGIAQNVTAQISNGSSYSTSAWVRLPSSEGTATGTITLKVATSTGTNYYTLASAAINDSGWTQITGGPFQVNWTGDLQVIEWYVSTSSGTADLLLDDASLTRQSS